MDRPTARAGLAGVLAAGVAIGVAELAAAVVTGSPSLVIAIGDRVIDVVPGWVERQAIRLLGTADKPALLIGIVVVLALLAGRIGVLARRRPRAGAVAVVALVAVGVVAALQDPRATAWGPPVVGLAAATAGVLALRLLLRAAAASTPTSAPPPPGADGPTDDPAADATPPSRGRRRLLRAGILASLVAAGGAVGGQLLQARRRVLRLREAIVLPDPADALPAPATAARVGVPGVTPLHVPNTEFYRIDTALSTPQVDPTGWRLRIHGAVDRPLELTYDQLLDMPHVEADVTLSCVSNEVGGGLVGNARWQGVRLRDLLDRVGLQEGAEQVLGRSVDGFTAGFPVAHALAEADALVAVGMNGEPLPARHGFPARLVVPGLYGYVSATKWLSDIELTGWDVDGYWIPRGWAKEGPVKTQSRIDVPGSGATLAAGPQAVAGVAWAPTRGVEGVEVRIDDGPWQRAELADALDVDAWRQWVLRWDATPGRHAIAVRATDGTGRTQTDERTDVRPDGATGHHTIRVTVA